MMGDRLVRQESLSISFGWTTTFLPITCCAPLIASSISMCSGGIWRLLQHDRTALDRSAN